LKKKPPHRIFDNYRGVRTTAAAIAIEENLVGYLVEQVAAVDLKLEVLPASPSIAKTFKL
jgi:hypothetical protein